MLTTAAVRAVAVAWPAARLAYLVGSAAAAGVRGSPHLSEIIDAPGTLGAYARLVWRLRRDRYSVALVFERGPQWPLLPFLAGIPVRAGIDSHWRGLGLTYPVPPKAGEHEAALAARVVQRLGLVVADLREEYRPTAIGQTRAEALMTRLAPGPRVVIHPGGGVNPGMTLLAKRWPPARFGALVERLTSAGVTVILAGAQSDRPAVDQVRTSLPPGVVVADVSGQLDLDAHAALVAGCDLYIGHDSGPTHLAAAVGCPTVVLFGPTDPGIYAPPGDHVRVVWRGARLDQASDLRDRQVDTAAIQAVTVDDVWQAAVDLLPALAHASPPVTT